VASSLRRGAGHEQRLFRGLHGGNRRVTDGVQMLSLSSVSRDFNAVGTRTDPGDPPDVVRFNLKRAQPIARLTNVNAMCWKASSLAPWSRSGTHRPVARASRAGSSSRRVRREKEVSAHHGDPWRAARHVQRGLQLSAPEFRRNGYVVLYTNPRVAPDTAALSATRSSAPIRAWTMTI